MDEPVDLVLPYVNMDDPLWLDQYLKDNPFDNSEYTQRQFRDFGTLESLLELIDRFCPWFRYIWFVVQMPSQIPECVKKYDKIKIVYHQDIIPEQFLPTYNSNTIDMFLWKIPGLSEHYIYANDDIYPIDYLTKDDFFDENGNPKLNIYTVDYDTPVSTEMYKQTLKNTERLCNPNFKERDVLYRDGHMWHAMSVSTWEMLFDKFSPEIYDRITKIRDERNITQQLYTYWVYFNGVYSKREFDARYFSLRKRGANILPEMKENHFKMICINDKCCNNFIVSKQNIQNVLNEVLNN